MGEREGAMLAGRGVGLAAVGGLLLWGMVAARLTFGAVPKRLIFVFDGT